MGKVVRLVIWFRLGGTMGQRYVLCKYRKSNGGNNNSYKLFYVGFAKLYAGGRSMKMLSVILGFLSKLVLVAACVIFAFLITGKIGFHNIFLEAILISSSMILWCVKFLIEKEQRLAQMTPEEREEEDRKNNDFVEKYADFNKKLSVSSFIIITIIIIVFYVVFV